MYFLLKMGIFHGYVSLLEGKPIFFAKIKNGDFWRILRFIQTMGGYGERKGVKVEVNKNLVRV